MMSNSVTTFTGERRIRAETPTEIDELDNLQTYRFNSNSTPWQPNNRRGSSLYASLNTLSYRAPRRDRNSERTPDSRMGKPALVGATVVLTIVLIANIAVIMLATFLICETWKQNEKMRSLIQCIQEGEISGIFKDLDNGWA